MKNFFKILKWQIQKLAGVDITKIEKLSSEKNHSSAEKTNVKKNEKEGK